MSLDQIEDIYPLAPVQEGMLFHSLYAPGSGVYDKILQCVVEGNLQPALFEQAWQQVIARHSILRSACLWQELDAPIQVVYRTVDITIGRHDWSTYPADEQQRLLEEHLAAQQESELDLTTPPLMRLALIRLGSNRHMFCWVYHHLLLDGWSASIVLGEVFTRYQELAAGQMAAIVPGHRYGEYIAWLQRQDQAQAKAFWRALLRGFSATTPLSVGNKAAEGVHEQTGHAEQQRLLAEPLTAGLRDLARRYELTLNTLMRGAWALLLSRYSGERDIVFGATVAGRPPELAEADRRVGLFINTLPVRIAADPQMALLPWLRAIQARQAAAQPYEHTPLVRIQEWSELPRGVQLFESILVFENFPIDAVLEAQQGGLLIRQVVAPERTNYPLTLVAAPGARLSLKLAYHQQRFDSAVIARMLGHLETLLAGMAASPHGTLAGYAMLTDAERRQIIAGWNQTAVDYPHDHLLHRLIEAQAARTPERVAVVFEQSHLTYAELDRRANQLAHRLRSHGVGPETLVGVCMERSLALVVALLGVLKAGAAYVPLDPGYPRDRLAFMLEDSRAAVLLTATTDDRRPTTDDRRPAVEDRGLKIENSDLGTEARLSSILHPPSSSESVVSGRWLVVDLVADWPTIAQQPATNPGHTAHPDNLAYMIYTSGSTGTPKGAMNTHGAICNRLLWMQAAYQLDPNDTVLQKTPFSFDVSVWEFFWPLLAGARLVVAQPGGQRDSAYLAQLITGEQITTVHFVPSMLELFIDEPQVAQCTSLRRVICSGEALPCELQERTFARLNAQLHNLYGPTEAAVDVTAWACVRDAASQPVPIGYPIANTQIYLLDGTMQPVPIGVPGDLYIGGAGLARGYFNRPDLTADRFVPNPFATTTDDRRPTTDSLDKVTRRQGDKVTEAAQEITLSPLHPVTVLGLPVGGQWSVVGGRLYRTGDLARYRDDGAIEFLGRSDSQIKLRGFRIELGEIEVALSQHPGIQQAAVLVREDAPGHRRLVAYLTPTTDHRRPTTEDRGLKIEDSFADASRELSSILHPPSSTESVVGGPSSVVGELRAFLHERLPEYMVPAVFVVLERFPLTPNGKLDRRALPAPTLNRADHDGQFVAARTRDEQTLATIWAQALNVTSVGVHESFFALGGDSLLALRVIARANQAGLALTLRQLFQHPTIAQLGELIGTAPLQPAQAPTAGPVPLTPSQWRFLAWNTPNPHYWNMGVLLETAAPLKIDLMHETLRLLALQHDALCLRLQCEAGTWQLETVDPALPIPCAYIDLAQHSPAERQSAIERQIAGMETSFDLAHAPFLKVAIVDCGPEQPGLLIVIGHFLALDIAAFQVLLEDLHSIYQQLERGDPVRQPTGSASFRQWAERLVAYAQTEQMREELAYWRSIALVHAELPRLPSDNPRGANTIFETRKRSVLLDTAETQALARALHECYSAGMADALIAALVEALAPLSGARALLIGLTAHGRTPLFADLDTSRTLGWLQTMFPVLIDLTSAGTPGNILAAVKQQLQAVPNEGIGYGILRYLSSDPAVVEQLRPLSQPDVVFNYMGPRAQVMNDLPMFKLISGLGGYSHDQHATRTLLLGLTCYIDLEGRLQLDWDYSEHVYHHATIEALAERFVVYLRALAQRPVLIDQAEAYALQVH